MRKVGVIAIGLAAILVCALAAPPAYAVPVQPNGSESLAILGQNTVNTGLNITAATTLLTLTGPIQVASFLDPFLAKPNNLCGAASGGCSAPHAPGFLQVGDPVTFSLLSFPVGGGVHVVNELVTICHGASCVDFTFTLEGTTALVASGPPGPNSAGTITVALLGTFTSDSTGTSYLLGQSASMSITCTQTAINEAIGCGGSIGTPAQIILTPEPASLLLLGLGLAGLGFVEIRRRRTE